MPNCSKGTIQFISPRFDGFNCVTPVLTQFLARARGLDSSRLLKLAQVQSELTASLEEMLALVDEVLHPEAYSREEICQGLGITSEQLSTEVLGSNTQHGE